MAPPKFADLSKKFKDLASDDFGFGAAKLTLKTQSAGGVNLKVEESRKFSDGTVSSLLEAKYTVAKGITVKTTWDSQNVVTVEEAFDSKLFKGSKSTITKAFNKGGSLTSDLKFKHEFSTDKLTTEHTFNFAELSSSTVFNFDNINLGASAVYDFSKGGIKSHAFAAQLTQSDTVFNATLTNGNQISGSIFHTPNGSTQVGAELGFKLGSADNTFSLVGKFNVDKDAFLKASLDKKLLLGLAYTQKLRAGVSLTLASQVDVNSLAADRHRLGASLTFEN